MEKKKPFLGRVLVVDDDLDILEVLSASLNAAGYLVTTAKNVTELKNNLSGRFYDAVVLDVFLRDEDGISAIPFITKNSPYSRIIMMSAHGTIELAVSAMKKGASSFISKSKSSEAILKLLSEGVSRPLESVESRPSSCGIVGTSTGVRDMVRCIESVKDVTSNVLIVGESGTGKELVARSIHQTSIRRNSRFAAINCGAVPENLLESELFGHKKGAYTDAKTDRKGLFELCSDGTLFLDEIGEMPIELQVKLLRVLQEREVTPLGSNHSIKVNTRVLAATNRNPLKEVSAGRFRQDLYYRLAVINIVLPSLSERKDDIPALVNHFLEKLNLQFNKNINPPSLEVLARLLAYDWPGNIRELQNCIERGVVLSTNGELTIDKMFLGSTGHESDDQAGAKSSTIDCRIPLSDAKNEFEREYLKQLLESTRGNIAEAARISHRYRADVYRLLQKHGLEWDDFRYPEKSYANDGS